jgi:hypothetical protein
MNRFKVAGLSFMFLGLIAALISGCATGPYVAPTTPTITINTIPSGADISIQGNYMGKSPLAIAMPAVRVDMGAYYQTVVGRADQPLQIETQLTGYETKTVSFGEFHAPEDEVIQPIFSSSATTKTKPGYYTFMNQITIKLSPSK